MAKNYYLPRDDSGKAQLLEHLARRLPASRTRHRSDPRLEFSAEAGAPEGALYLDGQLIGWLPGVCTCSCSPTAGCCLPSRRG